MIPNDLHFLKIVYTQDSSWDRFIFESCFSQGFFLVSSFQFPGLNTIILGLSCILPRTNKPITKQQFFCCCFLTSWLTTELLQRFLRVGFSVAALPDVASLQLYRDLHQGHGATTSLKMHHGKQLLAACPGLIVHLLTPSWREKKIQRGFTSTPRTASAYL